MVTLKLNNEVLDNAAFASLLSREVHRSVADVLLK